MKISGIICEYNPFHNGHLYHINETRKNGATHIVAVMSGNFVQRGDVAVMDKLERARLAVRSGADLVIELPVQYCLLPQKTSPRELSTFSIRWAQSMRYHSAASAAIRTLSRMPWTRWRPSLWSTAKRYVV